VLLTDHTDEALWTDTAILAEYKRQHLLEGATGFHWLKGPAAVAPLLLKTPARIRALGLVFLLALMVRNHLQFSLRRVREAQTDTILHPFTNKPIQNPTTEVALAHFGGLSTILQTSETSEVRRIPPVLWPMARKILELLGYDEDVYARPPDGRSRRRRNQEEVAT